MSDALADIDIDAALARIAACDLAGAEEAHARMMASEDAAEFADYGRTYQRLARSLRQSLALKARLAREKDAAQRERLVAEARKHARRGALRASLGDGLQLVTEPHEREEAFEALEREIERESERPDFLDADLDDLMAGICARLPLDDQGAETVNRVGWARSEGLIPDLPDRPPTPAPAGDAPRRESG